MSLDIPSHHEMHFFELVDSVSLQRERTNLRRMAQRAKSLKKEHDIREAVNLVAPTHNHLLHSVHVTFPNSR